MTIEIDPDIVRLPVTFKKGFSYFYLSSDSGCLNEVENHVANTVLFVECSKETDCDNKFSFGDGFFCTSFVSIQQEKNFIIVTACSY